MGKSFYKFKKRKIENEKRGYSIPKHLVNPCLATPFKEADISSEVWVVTRSGKVYGFDGSNFLELIFNEKGDLSSVEKMISINSKDYVAMTTTDDFRLAICCKHYLPRRSERGRANDYIFYLNSLLNDHIQVDICHAPQTLFKPCENTKHYKKEIHLKNCSKIVYLKLSDNYQYFALIYYTLFNELICNIYHFSGKTIRPFRVVDMSVAFAPLNEFDYIDWTTWHSKFNPSERMFITGCSTFLVVYDIKENHLYTIPTTHLQDMEVKSLLVTSNNADFVFVSEDNFYTNDNEADSQTVTVKVYQLQEKCINKVLEFNLTDLDFDSRSIHTVEFHYFTKVRLYVMAENVLCVVCPFQQKILRTYVHQDDSLEHKIFINWSGEEIYVACNLESDTTNWKLRVFHDSEDQSKPFKLSSLVKHYLLSNLTPAQLQSIQLSLPPSVKVSLGIL